MSAPPVPAIQAAAARHLTTAATTITRTTVIHITQTATRIIVRLHRDLSPVPAVAVQEDIPVHTVHRPVVAAEVGDKCCYI